MSTTYQSNDRYAHAAQEDRSAPRSRVTIPGTVRPSGSKGFQTQIKDLQQAVADNDGILPASEADAFDQAKAYLQTEVDGLQQLQADAQIEGCNT